MIMMKYSHLCMGASFLHLCLWGYYGVIGFFVDIRGMAFSILYCGLGLFYAYLADKVDEKFDKGI